MRRNGHLGRNTTDPAGFHVNVEHPFQSLSPTHRHMSLRECFLILIRCQFPAALAPPGRRHPHPVHTVRRKHTMEPAQVDSGLGYKGGQFGDDVQGCTNAAGAWMRRSGEIHWLEDDVSRAITIRLHPIHGPRR
jgi:hypothetical protein